MNVRKPRLSIIALSILLGLNNSVFAQESTSAAEHGQNHEDAPERVQVTGSRIKRSSDSPSPVQDISLKDLNQKGVVSLGEILQELPSVGASLNGNGSAGTSHGSSSLNLRSLGENRSLILVNGHRWVNGAGTRGFRDFVDLNTIPKAIVKRVEVLQDGATAIYGADAIAGVMNIYTHDEYVGAEISAYYGETSHGDKETLNLDMLWGNDIGDANVLFSMSYSDSEPVYTQARELTAVPLNGLSSGTPEGLFREANLASVLDFEIPTLGITRNAGQDGSDLDSWRAATSGDTYNRYDNNYVVGPQELFSTYLQAIIPFDSTEMRVEALYNRRESDQQFSPVLSVVRGSRGFSIPNNPLVNPFGVEFSGSDFQHTSFITENDYRVNAQVVETLRFGVGLEGEVDLGDFWSWDAFLSVASNKGEFTSYNQLHLDKLALGLQACDASAFDVDVGSLAQGCVPINLFNPLSDEVIDYINFTGRDENEAKQLDFTANISGVLFELPAGEVALAAGIEYRREEGVDTPDSTINDAPLLNTYRTTSSSPRYGTDGSYNLKEAYVELAIPLLREVTMAEYLELSVATRYSDYSTFGSTTNSKAGIQYKPVEDVSLRATWAEGFRAPSILELYEGERFTFSAVIDPCSGNNSSVGCAGVPASYVQPDSNVQLRTGGNRLLQPETSENISYGIVYEPASIDGFSITLDWFDIEIDNSITTVGAQSILDTCANTGRACDSITRDGSGEILEIIDGPINLNSLKVAGVDSVIRYTDSFWQGDWDFSLTISKLSTYEETSVLSDGSTVVDDKLGQARSREAYPEWRSSFSTRYERGPMTLAYSLRHIGDTTETFQGEELHIGTTVYHNINAVYEFDEQWTWTVGVNNIGDKQPPTSRTNANINFDQNTYNAIGRFMYTKVSYRF